MSDTPDCPSVAELNEHKTKLGVWVPPVVRKRLDELSEQDGVAISRRLASVVTEFAFPALAPGQMLTKKAPPAPRLLEGEPEGEPPFETIEEFEAMLVEAGMMKDADEAARFTAYIKSACALGMW